MKLGLGDIQEKNKLVVTSAKCEEVEAKRGAGIKRYKLLCIRWASQVVPVVKNPPASAGDERDAGLTPGSARSPGVGNGNPLQYPCLENPMDRGAWQAIVRRVTVRHD